MHETREITQEMQKLIPLARGGFIRDVIYINTVAREFQGEIYRLNIFSKGR